MRIEIPRLFWFVLIAGLFLQPQLLEAISQPLEQDWAYELDDLPVCVHSVDLDTDGRSETAVGVAPNSVSLLSYSGKSMWTYHAPCEVNAITAIPPRENRQAILIIGCYPMLIALGSDGESLWQTTVTDDNLARTFILIEVADLFNDGSLEIIAVCSDIAFIVAETGGLLGSFRIGFLPKQLNMSDINGDAQMEFLFGNHTTICCFNTKGKSLWCYATQADVPPIVVSPPQRSRVGEIFNLVDVDSNGTKEVVAGLIESPDSSSILCLDQRSGQAVWTHTICGLITGICTIEDGIYVGGVYPNHTQRSTGLLLKLGLSGKLRGPSVESPRYPLALTKIYNCILIEEYSTQDFVQANALGLLSTGAKPIRPILGAIYIRDYQVADLNADGYDDLVASWWWEHGRGVAGFLNKIPSIERRADKAWAQAERLIRGGDIHAAKREMTRGKEILLLLDKREEAESREREIVRMISQVEGERRKRLYVFVALIFFGAALSTILLYKYRQPLTERIYQLTLGVSKPSNRPAVTLLRELDREFLHEVVKKLSRLKLTLRHLENDPLSDTNWPAFNTIFLELRQSFQTYRDKLMSLRSGKFSALAVERDFKNLEMHLRHCIHGRITPDRMRAMSDSIASISQAIEKDLRAEIDVHKYNVHDALVKAIEAVKEDKRTELQSHSIAIRTEFADTNFAKIWFYDRFDRWQLIFLNFLRNAVEAIVKAIENNIIPQERRLVVIRLSKRYEKAVKAIVEIEDYGCGMDEYTQAHYFQDGFTFGKPKGLGSGINEATIEFIKQQGNITVTSQPNKGTKFVVEIWAR